MNQCSTILNHLMRHGRITSSVALSRYGVHSLSARIAELKMIGVKISSRRGEYTLDKPKHKVMAQRIIEEDDLFPDYNG